MEAVRSWADRLAELCNAYDGVESAAFNWMVKSGGRLSNYACIRLIVPSWYLLRDSIHRTLAEGEKEKWTAHKDKLAEAMAELDEVSTFSVTRMHFYF